MIVAHGIQKRTTLLNSLKITPKEKWMEVRDSLNNLSFLFQCFALVSDGFHFFDL
jgi:hypothetical protein